MPDILIRGMEMPQSCAKCDLFGEYGCAFIGSVGYALTENRRSDDCPLHELPPHGELIDRDAFIAEIKKNDTYQNWLFRKMLEKQPVVVPAERSDTDA